MLHDDDVLCDNFNNFDRVEIHNGDKENDIDIESDGSDEASVSNTPSQIHNGICFYCVDKRINIIYLPCGHATSCDECFEKFKNAHEIKCRDLYRDEIELYNENINKYRCPFCRMVIERTNPFYLVSM